MKTYHLMTLMRLAAVLKRDILLPQPINTPHDQAPKYLPPTIEAFLADALGILAKDVRYCWSAIKEEVWDMPTVVLTAVEEEMFKVHGWKRGLTSRSLYPPSQYCTNVVCSKQGSVLKREEQRQAVLYTLANGAQPAWSIHVACTACHSNCHHNFSVHNDVRTYYAGVPEYVQVGDHQFVEAKLVELWITSMLVGWVSATNCARLYDLALSGRNTENAAEGGWQFGFKLTTGHVWDVFVIKTLMEDRVRHQTLLEVPHTGKQRERFNSLMEERNTRIVLQGQDEVPHTCNRCTRIFKGKDGETRRCQVIVTDGLTLGDPCCAVPNCKEPLQSNKHRFCRTHFPQHDICAIRGCENPATAKNKTCDLPQHREMERLSLERGKSMFTLKHRLL
ncbi:hypothetical protein HGRIS_003855, partial [Hohenbuehelia grisea]